MIQVSILASQIGDAQKLRNLLKEWIALCYIDTSFDEFLETTLNNNYLNSI